MSQDAGNINNNQQLHDSSEILSTEVTLEGIYSYMTQNFAKIFETLEFMIQGQALIFANLKMLLENPQPMQEQETALNADPDGFQPDVQPQQQHPVDFPPSPAPSETSENDNLASDETSPTVRCADCGQTFIRKKSKDSITHHANTTDCKPFECSVCKKLFKNASKRNQHERKELLKRKTAGASHQNGEPSAKRLKQDDEEIAAKSASNNQEKDIGIESLQGTWPLKDLAFKSNQVQDNSRKDEEQVANDDPVDLTFKSPVSLTFKSSAKKKVVKQTGLKFLDELSDDEN